jgi:hypothetical protein
MDQIEKNNNLKDIAEKLVNEIINISVNKSRMHLSLSFIYFITNSCLKVLVKWQH